MWTCWYHLLYAARDLHVTALVVCVDAVHRGDVTAPPLDHADTELIDSPLLLSVTSSVSNSSSPMLLDAVLLLVGDCGILRRDGADLTLRGLYTHTHRQQQQRQQQQQQQHIILQCKMLAVTQHLSTASNEHVLNQLLSICAKNKLEMQTSQKLVGTS